MTQQSTKSACLKYIQFVSKMLGTASFSINEELFYLFVNGYVSNGVITAEDIKEAFADMNEGIEPQRLKIKISQFKSKGRASQLFYVQTTDKKRNLVLNGAFFTSNGMYNTDNTKLVLEFKNGNLEAYNPSLSTFKTLIANDITSADYYTWLSMRDKKKNMKDITIEAILNLFEDGEYQLDNGSRNNRKDHLKVGLKYAKNLKEKLNNGVIVGTLFEESPLLYSLNTDIIPSLQWFNDFTNQTINIELDFQNEEIKITQI